MALLLEQRSSKGIGGKACPKFEVAKPQQLKPKLTRPTVGHCGAQNKTRKYQNKISLIPSLSQKLTKRQDFKVSVEVDGLTDEKATFDDISRPKMK